MSTCDRDSGAGRKWRESSYPLIEIAGAAEIATLEPMSDSVSAPKWHAVCWLVSVCAFGAGFWVGMKVDAEAGLGLWVLSAATALAPFASHRDRV